MKRMQWTLSALFVGLGLILSSLLLFDNMGLPIIAFAFFVTGNLLFFSSLIIGIILFLTGECFDDKCIVSFLILMIIGLGFLFLPILTLFLPGPLNVVEHPIKAPDDIWISEDVVPCADILSPGVPPTPILPNLSEIVEEKLKKLAPGQILFNPPKEMKVGVRERMEVRIAKSITENLTVNLTGHGEPQIKNIKVGTFMTVRLVGDNFDIKALSHEEQVVAGEGFTQWDWDVVPLKSGRQLLLLVVTVRIKISNYDEEYIDYLVFERLIEVKVNPIYSIINFVESYWQWIVTTIIGSGIVGWILKKRVSSSKKK